jgi:hypothetical protein
MSASVFSGLPNTLIMDIIRESTTAELMDYWTERAPTVFRDARPNEAMFRSFNWSGRAGSGFEKRVEWVAVKNKSALNREFNSQIDLDELDEEYEKYDFEYEGENDINGGLYLIVGGFLYDWAWVKDDNQFNVDLDELENFHPTRE